MENSRILPEFDLLLPASVAEAVKMLSVYKDKASVMAGGTDIIVSATQGFVSPYVISMAKIKELDYITFDKATGLRIGAMTTLQKIADSPVVQKEYPALCKSAAINGTGQTRNMGTAVGNIMRASPSGDCACAVLALGGTLVLQSAAGTREVSVDEFFIGYKKTARKPDELAVELKLPPPATASKSAFNRITRTTLDLSKVNCAVSLQMKGETCTQARIAMGAVAPTTLRLKKSEELLKGQKITDELLKKVAASVAGQIVPIDDVRSTAEYRKDVSGVILKRTIQTALAQ
jgi:carbon-monoxide dehydrogenase medium subunit